jgi:RNA polymerase sigma factor (sigma-70 family)
MAERQVVERAQAGDRAALDALVHEAKDLVFNLAVRMLGNRDDAEDVSQEILIRVVTSLSTFRGESAFRTWVYRIAANHLLRAKKEGQKEDSFEAIEEFLDRGIEADMPALEDQFLVTEARLVCTTRMITALDRDHRLAFVLGEILELSSDEGAAALEITPEAFRKRLSRARERMGEFMAKRCGIFDPARPCRCGKQAACAVKAGYLSRESVKLAAIPVKTAHPMGDVAALNELEKVAAIVKSHPEYAGPESLISGLKTLLARP